MENETRIKNISNSCGSLYVREDDGKYYWSIEGRDGHDWDYI